MITACTLVRLKCPQTLPHTHCHPHPLAGRGEGQLRSRCQAGSPRASPPGHPGHLVPPHGHLHQEERVAQEDNRLNRHTTRHCQSPFHQARAVPGNTKKTIFDAWNGYHSVALALKRGISPPLLPHGVGIDTNLPPKDTSPPNTARYDALVSSITRKTKCIDDALLWAPKRSTKPRSG